MTPQQRASLIQRYPFRVVMDPKTGEATNRVLTCPVRGQWLQLDKLAPHPKYPDGKPQAGGTLIIPPEASIAPMEALGKSICGAHFGAALNKPVIVRGPDGNEVQSTVAKTLAWPWRRQIKYAGKPGFSADGAGYFIRANSLYLPRILGHDRQPMLPTDPAIYNGAWFIALLELNAYPKEGAKQGDEAKRGLRATLVQLMKIADDEVLPAGSANADDAFADIDVPNDLVASAATGANGLASGADVAW